MSTAAVGEERTASLPSSAQWGILLLRAMIAVVFLVHGGQKLFVFGFRGVTGFFGQIGVPLPAVSAVVVTLVEFFSGLALLLGLFTRVFALLLALDMVGALLLVHLKNGFFVPDGVEYVLTLLVANLALVLAGAGALALDNKISERRH